LRFKDYVDSSRELSLNGAVPCGTGFWIICPSIYSLAGLVSGSFRNSSKVMGLDGDCTIGTSLGQEFDDVKF